MLLSSTKIKSFALNKDNYISISLNTHKTHKKPQKKSAVSAPVEIPVEIAVTPVNENIDVNNLFSDVWTKKIIKKKIKPKNSRLIHELQKKIPISKKNRRKSLSKIDSDENVKSNEESASGSTASEVNEYLAKIQALVYKYFNVPPNSEGHSVKAVIFLNSLGKMIDFRVLNYSSNDALNKEVDKIKERLRNVVFPINKKNKSTKTIVILTSKE